MTLKQKLLNGEKLIGIWAGFILKKWGLNIITLEPSTGGRMKATEGTNA